MCFEIRGVFYCGIIINNVFIILLRYIYFVSNFLLLLLKVCVYFCVCILWFFLIKIYC